MTDEDILALIKHRKQEGLSYLLEKYGGLMKYIVKNTGCLNDEDVSDCMSDILYTIWKRINHYNDVKASFKTWVLIVTRGCSVDFLRKNMKHKNVVSFEEIEDISVADNAYTGLHDYSVLSLLQELTPPDNEIFYRRFVLGEKVEEIAKRLRITKDNVYKRLSRGKEKLRSLMLEEGYGNVK